MDDRLVPRDATDLQANAQPKAVFSYAMTVMDKICGWDEEEKWWGLYLELVCESAPNACCVIDRKPLSISWEKDAVNYGKCLLGLCGSSGGT